MSIIVLKQPEPYASAWVVDNHLVTAETRAEHSKRINEVPRGSPIERAGRVPISTLEDGGTRGVGARFPDRRFNSMVWRNEAIEKDEVARGG